MRKALSTAVLAFATMVATIALAVPAGAVTIDVFPGESIQEAVHAAVPGDTIVVHAGVYEESVSIRKDGIQLVGEGASDTGTVLHPPTGDARVCSHGSFGICVFSRSGAVVTDVHISGFMVEGFPIFGVIGFGTHGLLVEDNAFIDDGAYGAAGFATVGTTMRNNVATGNDIGLYIGDSLDARSEIVGNDVFGNGSFGIFVRSAAVGTVRDNSIHHNCSGIYLLNEGTITPSAWEIRGNTIFKNNAFCPGDGGLSGIGIVIFGGDANVIRGNDISRNRPSGDVRFSGGVVLLESFDGSTSDGNVVAGNTLTRNRPNVFDDGTGHGNRFVNNDCTGPC